MAKISVLGAGAWGTVIGNLLVNNGHDVIVWARNKEQVNELNKTHKHKNLPEILLNDKLMFSNDFATTIVSSEIIVYAIPSTAFRSVVHDSLKYINENMYLVSLAKGMEDTTLFTMTDIIKDEFKKAHIRNDKIIALSGPTISKEVGLGYPSMAVSASSKLEYAKYIQDIFMNERFRVYTNTDLTGVEICAAFKNVIALASGIIAGLGFGDNLRAALITRGLTEMIRVGEKLKCKKDTFYGLAGIGDMIVTATSENSRNYSCGKLIGVGYKTNDAIEKIGMVCEGVNFLPKAYGLMKKYNIELPISEGAYEIVINGKEPKDILTLLMTRSKKSE